MKVRLMHPRYDFDPDMEGLSFPDDVRADLQLEYLWEEMGGGDAFLRDIARSATLQPQTDPEAIQHRQDALSDYLRNSETVRALYEIAVDAVELRRGIFMLPVRNNPPAELNHAADLLSKLSGQLERIRTLGASQRGFFKSSAFRSFFTMVDTELDDAYMLRLRGTLRQLRFPDGVLMSAGLGPGGQVSSQVLRRGKQRNKRWFDRTPLKRPYLSFTLPDRDEAGTNALSELRARSVNDVANAATQAMEHVIAFFARLRNELGFYLACGNLISALTQLGAPFCFPTVATESGTDAVGLYDPCLAVQSGAVPTGNPIATGTCALLVITGANHGGKSTFLRALGSAQLMMQAGMPVAAESFSAIPVGQVHTHWAREEDAELQHGKLDDELARMEEIVSVVEPGDLVLCNESFASTNEAEGSEILLEVTRALLQSGVYLRIVTHLYDFAHTVSDDASVHAAFLRAERGDSGNRHFHIVPGEPLSTSYGRDLYDQQFGTHFANSDESP